MNIPCPTRPVHCPAACAALFLLMALSCAASESPDYSKPDPLTGTIYERGSGKVLFKFQRRTAQTGDTVHVIRNFTSPDGSLAARETITYARGKLVSFHSDKRQIDSKVTIAVAADPRSQGKELLRFESTSKSKTEPLQPDTLVSDMIPYFVAEHWNQLMNGAEVKFRFIAESRLETVGFKLVKDSERTLRGQPVVRLKMEPSSFIIAQLVDPIYFTVEKTGLHRILEYDGRTTPLRRDGNKWKDLDARTVYDW